MNDHRHEKPIHEIKNKASMDRKSLAVSHVLDWLDIKIESKLTPSLTGVKHIGSNL